MLFRSISFELQISCNIVCSLVFGTGILERRWSGGKHCKTLTKVLPVTSPLQQYHMRLIES